MKSKKMLHLSVSLNVSNYLHSAAKLTRWNRKIIKYLPIKGDLVPRVANAKESRLICFTVQNIIAKLF